MSDTGDQGQGWGPPPPPPGAPVPPPAPPGWQPAPPPRGTPPPAHAYRLRRPPALPTGARVSAGTAGYPPQPGYGYGTPYPQASEERRPGDRRARLRHRGHPEFCGIGLILGVLGLVFGIVADAARSTAPPGRSPGAALALAGAICGGVGLAINVLYWGMVIIVVAISRLVD